MSTSEASLRDSLAGLQSAVRAAVAARTTLAVRGGGSKDFYGQAATGAPLDTRGYTGIVAYEPSELVITARGGTPLRELEAAVQARRQMLAFEPPHFGSAATVGGMVAAGLSGPRRQAAGAVRDHVLGVRLLDGQGNVLTFGGQVMKNVAGYDVSRLLVGSMGALGVILEVSIKVLPLPLSEITLKFELPEARAIETLNRWAGRPLPISASAWHGGDLSVRLSGADAAVRAARERLGGELIDAERAAQFWRDVREQELTFFAGATPLWRVSVPATANTLEVPGEQLIEWGGALRWLRTNADARTVRDAATRAGGHATLFRGGDKAVGVFTALAAPLERIHRHLKITFDPQRVFDAGRLFPSLAA